MSASFATASASASVFDWLPLSGHSFCLLVVPGLLILIILWLCDHQYDRVLGRPPPGPWGLPWLGYLPFLSRRAPHKSLQALARRYGGIYQLRMGSVKAVILSDVTLVREFFRHEVMAARAPLYLTHGIMGGYGIICAAGPIWKHQRRELIDWLKALGMTRRPGETRSRLEQRIGRGVDECVQLYETDADVSPSSEFDPVPALQHTLGNIINDLVFGVTYERQDADWLYLQRLQEEGVKLIGVSGVVNFLPWLRRLPWNRRNICFLMEGKSRTHAIYDRIVESCENKLKELQEQYQEKQRQRQQQQDIQQYPQQDLQQDPEPESESEQSLQQSTEQKGERQVAAAAQEVPHEQVPAKKEDQDPNQHAEQKQVGDRVTEHEQKQGPEQEEDQKEEEEEDDDDDVYEPTCILEHFLINRVPFSELYCDEQLRHLLADLFGAGVDTSLATLRWFLLYMAREQSSQRRLHELLLPLSATPTLEELQPLAFLRACISEVQRIRSVVPLGIPHGAERDFTVGKYRIAAGSMIVSLQWAIHMDPAVWPEPEQFRPDRFLNAEGHYSAPPQFVPFQTGKRMCPGDELARMMLTLFAGRILRRFHVEMVPGCDADMEGECGITLAPAPYKLRFTKLPPMELQVEEQPLVQA
ncbi:cytochrome P450 306a1 [Drosophila miranda]|uniref:cytochrome P450 306a1 n=1 Tax=Drosophila miranda TaxID=7229 RepID=UPI0007E7173D|nr:cytochrome P450 306a1 [Drosophila miranda]